MKQNIIIILSVAFLLLLPACGADNKGGDYTVYGEVSDHSLDGSYLFIRRSGVAEENRVPADSVRIENGRFVLSGKTDKPCLLSVWCANRLRGEFIAESGEIRYKFDPSQDYLAAEISGTPINDEYQKMIVEPKNAYQRIAGPLERWKQERIEAHTWTSEDAKTFAREIPGPDVYLKMESERMAFIDKYIQEFDVVESMLVLYAYTESSLNNYTAGDASFKSMENPFTARNARWMSQLSKAERTRLKQAIEAHNRQLEKMTRNPGEDDPDEIIPDAVRVGGHFVDFERTTAEDKPFSLKKAVENNKLVMLDFWVSPNRTMLPNIAKLHEKYKDKGLLVVGVSLDQDEDRWHGTIKRLDMKWPQVRSIGNDTINGIYGVRFMPHIILIDRKGTIVARKLRGSELENKIVEMLE